MSVTPLSDAALGKTPLGIRIVRGLVAALRGFPAWVPLLASSASFGKIILYGWLLFQYPSSIETALNNAGYERGVMMPVFAMWMWTTASLAALAAYLRREHGSWNGPKKEATT